MVSLIAVTLAAPALATWTRGIDDDCKGAYPTPYFYAAGPSNYWYTNSGGVNNCHMWTTTVDQSISAVNLAWWYTDPGDPTDYGSAVVNMTGVDNSCGYVYYHLHPSGEYGADDLYYISQAGPAAPTIFSGVYLIPADGAKVDLPDNQPCAVNSSIQADYLQFSEP